ncbi:hypothetical protein AB0L74_10135 [Streptomyces sp. NPDC052020]|uniref:hypothetical protein n=1 Tax=Streptomyces sp. NPDC052020 TaxID=3155677 RepID=UPI003440F5D1
MAEELRQGLEGDAEEVQRDGPAEAAEVDSPVLAKLRRLISEENRRRAEHGSLGNTL